MPLVLIIKPEDERLFCARDWQLINRLAVEEPEDEEEEQSTQPIDDSDSEADDGEGALKKLRT